MPCMSLVQLDWVIYYIKAGKQLPQMWLSQPGFQFYDLYMLILQSVRQLIMRFLLQPDLLSQHLQVFLPFYRSPTLYFLKKARQAYFHIHDN
mgnify:CR=1 FL=1